MRPLQNLRIVEEVRAWWHILSAVVVMEKASEYEPVRVSLESTAFCWLWLTFALTKRSYVEPGVSSEKRRMDTTEGKI